MLESLRNGRSVQGLVLTLCLGAADTRLRAFSFEPLDCLLLTQPGGDVLAFAVVLAAMGARYIRNGDWFSTPLTFLQGVLATALFAVFQPLTVDGLAQTAALISVFLYRSDYTRDGLRLWLTVLLLGVGSGNGQCFYSYVQTAPSETIVVHSSFVWSLVDSDIAGVAFLVAACVFGIWSLREELDAWAEASLFSGAFISLRVCVSLCLGVTLCQAIGGAIMGGKCKACVPLHGGSRLVQADA